VLVGLLALTTFSPSVTLASVETETNRGESVSPARLVDAQSNATTTFNVTVTASGEGRWTITHTYPLTNASERTAFDALRTDIQSNTERYTNRVAARFAQSVSLARSATGRPMMLTDPTVDVTRPNTSTGQVTYAFTWDGFAAVEESTVVVDTPLDGLYLDDTTTLTMEWSSALSLDTASPTPTATDDRLYWAGEQTLDDATVRFDITTGEESNGLSMGVLAGGLLTVVFVLGVILAIRRYRT
jgi:hypothetical protein